VPQKPLTKLNIVLVVVFFSIVIGVGIYHLVTGAHPPRGTGTLAENGRLVGFCLVAFGVTVLSALVHRIRNERKK